MQLGERDQARRRHVATSQAPSGRSQEPGLAWHATESGVGEGFGRGNGKATARKLIESCSGAGNHKPVFKHSGALHACLPAMCQAGLMGGPLQSDPGLSGQRLKRVKHVKQAPIYRFLVARCCFCKQGVLAGASQRKFLSSFTRWFLDPESLIKSEIHHQHHHGTDIMA